MADRIKPEEPTQRGEIICARMMVYMLEIGFTKKQLPALEKIFWQVRDRNGDVRRPGTELTIKEKV